MHFRKSWKIIFFCLITLISSRLAYNKIPVNPNPSRKEHSKDNFFNDLDNKLNDFEKVYFGNLTDPEYFTNNMELHTN